MHFRGTWTIWSNFPFTKMLTERKKCTLLVQKPKQCINTVQLENLEKVDLYKNSKLSICVRILNILKCTNEIVPVTLKRFIVRCIKGCHNFVRSFIFLSFLTFHSVRSYAFHWRIDYQRPSLPSKARTERKKRHSVHASWRLTFFCKEKNCKHFVFFELLKLCQNGVFWWLLCC